MNKRGTYSLTNDLPEDTYLIMTTSIYNDSIKPCDSAVQLTLPYRDVRSTDDPAKTPAYGGDTEWWYGQGTNHQLLDDGCIYRELRERPMWVVTVPDLRAFVEEEGRCIIEIDRGRPSIEIYDEWRE